MLKNHYVAALALALVGCNGDDSSNASASASATGASLSGTSGSGSDTTSVSGASDSATGTSLSGASGSESDATSASGASDSATTTGDTGVASDSTGGTSQTTTEMTTVGGTETGSSTTGDEVPICGDDLPKGYMGQVNQECENEPQLGMFNPVVEWQKTEWTVAPAYNQVLMAPIVAELDGDDIPDILYVTHSLGNYKGPSVIRAVSGDGQKEVLSIDQQGVTGSSGLAAGDIDGDGLVEIIAFAAGGVVKAFENDGSLKWTSPNLSGHVLSFHIAAPAIADLEGDGDPEIIAGRAILNSDGTLRGAGAYGTGTWLYGSASFAADILNDDGIQEVIVGNAIYNADGEAYWYNRQPDGYPAIADFDLDGQAEIIVVSNGTVRLQDAAGNVLWNVANPGGKGGPPTIADYDGDGLPEVGVAGRTAYVVFDTDGSILWQKATKDGSGITGSSVYDFEGDGIADVVYADEVNLYVYSGIDGTIKLQYEPHSNGTHIDYPLVVDVDNDGQVEIIVGHNTLLGGGAVGLTVIGDMDESWRPGRKIWNQHAFSITNVNDDGTIPAAPPPNWLSYNNFRSGDLSEPDGLKAPDLVMLSPDSCVNECSGDDQVTVWVQLGNEGAVPLTAGVTINVYGTSQGVESLILVVPVDIILQAGEFADALSIDVDTSGIDELRLEALPNEVECIVDPANEIVLEAPFCTSPG